MISLILISLAIAQTHQATKKYSNMNCMEANRGALDGYFNIYNKQENVWSVTNEDVKKQISLFSTRFNRAHVFTGNTPGHMKFIAEGVSQYASASNKSTTLFLSSHPGTITNDINGTTVLWKEAYQSIKDIRKNMQNLRIGLYLTSVLNGWSMWLKAIEKAFGMEQDPEIPLGIYLEDCSPNFNNPRALKVFQRLRFVTCGIFPAWRPSAEESAEDVIRKCDLLRDNAYSKNITAAIMCAVRYQSEGISINGVVGSVSDFQTFWCTVVSEIARNNSHAQIIMYSAFDDTPILYGRDETELHEAVYHTGWWRRIEGTSYESNAFVEKVEEILDLPLFSSCTKKPTLDELSFAITAEIKRQHTISESV